MTAGGAGLRLGFAADIWSLAASIRYIFTAAAPYSGLSFWQVIAALTTERLPPSVPESVPAALRELLMRCFDFVPESRPQISEIVQQLQVRSECMLPSNISHAWKNSFFVLDAGNVVYCWCLRCHSVHSQL